MNILFVCSGNTCRSPMAEGYLNSKNITSLNALSCGFISEGEKASENAVAVMKEIGVDIAAHKSRLASNGLLAADKIFCMTPAHKNALALAGVSPDKISVLAGGISDPYGRDISVYRQCRDEITAAIDNALYGGEMLPVKILTADESDAADIADLEKQVFSSPWSENAVLEGMRHNTVFFKAVYKGDFAGYAGVTAVAGEGYINNIAVKNGFRGKGVGSLLLDRAITFARAEQLDFLSLEVRKSNSAAIRLYRKAGFETAGERKNFYEDPREDGIIMTRRFRL